MTELILEYSLFLAKTVTVLMALGLVIMMLGRLRRTHQRLPETLEVVHLNQKYADMRRVLRQTTLPRRQFHHALRAERAEQRSRKKKLSRSKETPKRIFVLDFHGDITATEVGALRESITAILQEASAEDEVLVRLENAGGLVHEHGLAASQLARIRQRQIRLTVAVDKVAASGGYLMACVADRIIAAPFAILGSIGVLAQLPNFHQLLSRHGIEFEQLKAGDYKRTLTVFGENREEDRARLQAQLDDTHALFQGFVQEYRPKLDLEKIATGEAWHGKQALGLGLVDDLMTSDDYLMGTSGEAELYLVEYSVKKRPFERLVSSIRAVAGTLLPR
jgi:serine protease SohB